VPPKDKSIAAALVLPFLFGPLGLFYASASCALTLMVGGVVIGVLTFGLGFLVVGFFIWPISMVWGALAASSKHQKCQVWQTPRLSHG
jgi:hypothetical protein